MLIRSLSHYQAAGSKPQSAPQTSARPPEDEPPSYDRKDRISHFLQQAGSELLTQTRHLASAYAGQLVATTAGVLLCAPLANAVGQIHVLTVGGTLAAAAGAVAGYLLERNVLPEIPELASPLLSGLGVARALPNFVYPTLQNATAAEQSLIYSTLDKLPMGDVTSVSTMTVMEGMGGMGISGVAPPTLSQNVVYFDRRSLNSRWFGPELVTHELAHGKDMAAGHGPIGSLSMRGAFGRPPFVSGYARTNFIEDFAESYVEYHKDPAGLREAAPAKFEALDAAHPRGFSEWLTDRPSVRDAGKKTAEVVGKVPYLRAGLELAGSLIAPLQIRHGAALMEKGDSLKGKAHLASGIFLLTGGGLPLVAGAALAGISGDERAGDLALASSLGPLGFAGLAVTRELEQQGYDLNKSFPGVEFDGERHLEGLAFGLVGSGLGGVGGAFWGALSGGSPGAAVAGSAWGGLLGAGLGLGAYALKSWGQAGEDSSGLALTRDDKIFLLKTGGSALTGAIGGGVGGAYLGQFAGRALGNMVGGPVAAELSGSVGRIAGGLAGSAGLARVGARLGHQWAEATAASD